MNKLKVTCAVISAKQQILACQNNETARHALQWEFPGGKIEPFETESQCIVREIKEELNIDIEIIQRLKPITHHYPDFELELIPFEVKIIAGTPEVKTHKTVQWIIATNIATLNWAETDHKLIEVNKEYFKKLR